MKRRGFFQTLAGIAAGGAVAAKAPAKVVEPKLRRVDLVELERKTRGDLRCTITCDESEFQREMGRAIAAQLKQMHKLQMRKNGKSWLMADMHYAEMMNHGGMSLNEIRRRCESPPIDVTLCGDTFRRWM